VGDDEKPWIDNYLIGGRRFKKLNAASLKEAWSAAGDRARNAGGSIALREAALLEMDDIEAEFNLRGLEAPRRRWH
jgi:hypothetical protein